MQPITVTRTRQRLLPDARRVLAKPFLPGEELLLAGSSRASLLLERILAIPEAQVAQLLDAILLDFASRHRGFEQLLDRHFAMVSHHIPRGQEPSVERRRLIGAYFTHEYAVEAAALFNPSLVLAPGPHDALAGPARVVMSLRAVGEGHISSIEFRSGYIDDAGELCLDSAGPYLVPGLRTPPSVYDKALFRAKLQELDASNALSDAVLERLPEFFRLGELEGSLALLEARGSAAIGFETAKIIRVLAASSYVTEFPSDSELDERVLFPAGPNETRGMEDARFVRFADDDGSHTYYATYTAYDGFNILPQLIETRDFVRFAISTLHGAAAQNKGMALFPRRIGGRYVMLSRKDRENLYLATSSDVHAWDEAIELHKPVQPWELAQIGNCGSPLETDAGWLVLTHGVGPMRRYTLGALLLDLDDPSRVIGQLPVPLLEPDASEREGYVPNVLYSCGALLHDGQLHLPYGFSDAGVGVARIDMAELLAHMR
jgi:predicted GH43/DUF377 family glycosyl hydrolase